MSKSVVINLGNSDLYGGCEQVTAQLWVSNHPLPEQFVGSLPPAPHLVELYQRWQFMYRNFYDCLNLRFRSLSEEDDEIEIDQSDITNISDVSFNDLSRHLRLNINAWLKSEEFLNVERKLRSALSREEEIQIVIETNDLWLRRIPWCWWDLIDDYPSAEIALFRPEYRRSTVVTQSRLAKNKVRVLAVMGNSFGIDLVITLRADFYGHALSYRPFCDALQGAVLNLAETREAPHLPVIGKCRDESEDKNLASSKENVNLLTSS